MEETERSYPKPSGWSGGSDDWSFLRSFDGHIGVNVNSDPECAADLDYRRNAKSSSRAHIGGRYDTDGD